MVTSIEMRRNSKRERGSGINLGPHGLEFAIKRKKDSLRGSFFQAMDLVKAKVANLASAFC